MRRLSILGTASWNRGGCHTLRQPSTGDCHRILSIRKALILDDDNSTKMNTLSWGNLQRQSHLAAAEVKAGETKMSWGIK